ncbi:MAG: hypothetical protein REJ23_16250 [Brevundimonas sp.]|nr:hypothetical protein [Brevundimonas sp.]
MRNGLVALTALLGLTACYPVKVMQYDRPDAATVLDRVRAGEADRAELTNGRRVDLNNAVTAEGLICSATLSPACLSAATVARLETREAPDTPLWVYAVALPFTPIVLVNEAGEGLERALTGGPQTFSDIWAADALIEYNPCIPHVRRDADGAWPSDQRIRADLHRRRAELGGGCLVRLGAEYAYPVATRRRLHLTGLVRQRFEAFACVQRRPEAEAAAPTAFVPRGMSHTGGREVDWPGELRVILADPQTWAPTSDLAAGCAGAGGVAPDLSPATRRAREGWPIPSTGPAA